MIYKVRDFRNEEYKFISHYSLIIYISKFISVELCRHAWFVFTEMIYMGNNKTENNNCYK